MKRTIFENCKFLFKEASATGVVTGHSVVVEDDKIVAVGLAEVIQRQYEQDQVAERINCKNKIVMPGLVDGHNHLCNTHMNLARAYKVDYSRISEHLLTTIHDPYGWLTEESIYDITTASILNGLKHGATTISNCTILPDAAYRAMDDMKIRGILAPQMSSSIRLDADDLNWKQYLQKTRDCLNNYHKKGEGLIDIVVHPHVPWDCLEKMQLQAFEMAEEYDTKYVTHFFEFPAAVEKMNKLFASEGGALKHYEKMGLVNERCVLFHGSQLTVEEIGELAKTGASIIHNPDINGTNGGFCAYIPEMIDAGVNVGLGCDYGSLDMMTAMKLMRIVHHIMPREKRVLAEWMPLYAATLGSAKAYGLEKKVGSIEVGKQADLITIDLTRASELLPMCTKVMSVQSDILYFLFTRNCAGIETSETMINGRFIRKNREFTMIDEEKIVAKAYEWCETCMDDLNVLQETKGHYARMIHEEFVRDEAIQHNIL